MFIDVQNPKTRSDFTVTFCPPASGWDKRIEKDAPDLPSDASDEEFKKALTQAMMQLEATDVEVTFLQTFDVFDKRPWKHLFK